MPELAVAKRARLSPTQRAELLLTVKVVAGFKVTRVDAVAVQLLPSLTVTVYVVLEVGLT